MHGEPLFQELEGQEEEMVMEDLEAEESLLGEEQDFEADQGEATEAGTRVTRHPSLGYVWSRPGQATSAELDEVDREIIPPDQRVAIQNTLAVPYRWICHLELNFGPDPGAPGNSIIARGTGTLIGPGHVLTCGHNLFNDFPGAAAREVRAIRVSPGHNCAGRKAAPLGTTRGVRWRFAAPWRASRNIQHDVGLIKLASPIGSQNFPSLGTQPLGFWGSAQWGAGTKINPLPPGQLTGKTINISGYPGDKCCFRAFDPARACSDSAWAGAQFRSTGRVTSGGPAAAPRVVLYDLDTFGGHSGSPVWLKFGQARNLIAIHTGPGFVVDPAEAGRSNRGVRITQEVLNLVRGWLKTM